MPAHFFHIRRASLHDLAAIERIQHECYGADFHEGQDAFANKIRQAPDYCLVAECAQGTVLGYFMCLLASVERFPCLHADDFQCPGDPDILYLHDMALSASARGRGLRQAFLAAIYSTARQNQALKDVFLVAVQGAEVVWEREGFQPVNARAVGLSASLETYGSSAVLMKKPLQPAVAR